MPRWYEGPTADQIYKAILPTHQFQTFWNNSFPNEESCYECGGWFYADPNDKTRIEIVPAPQGDEVPQKEEDDDPAAIDLNNPSGPRTAGWILVGNFHTHPLSEAMRGNQEPSRADKDLAWKRQVPGIVISRKGFFKYGEDTREDLRNPQGYPPKPSGSPHIVTPKRIPGSGRPNRAPNQYNED